VVGLWVKYGNMINFIHIPKNAGMSFKKMILNDGPLSKILKYHFHEVDVYKIQGPQLLIFREPIDRFISAFFYNKAYPNTRVNISPHIRTPNDLAEMLADGHDQIIEEKLHFVGDRVRGIQYVFVPQYHWFNSPDTVLRYSKLEEDFNHFLKCIEHPPIELEHVNKSPKNKNFEFSDKSMNFLHEYYKKDFEIYNTLKCS